MMIWIQRRLTWATLGYYLGGFGVFGCAEVMDAAWNHHLWPQYAIAVTGCSMFWGIAVNCEIRRKALARENGSMRGVVRYRVDAELEPGVWIRGINLATELEARELLVDLQQTDECLAGAVVRVVTTETIVLRRNEGEKTT